jgi:hypothetical protein
MNWGTFLTVMAALLGGGFAGAVFQWYVTRPEPTVVTYTVTTTAVRAGTLKTAVPDLKILVAGEEIPALYTHTVQVAVARGRDVETAELAIELPQSSLIKLFGYPDTEPKETRIFGVSTEAPSAIHKIECTQLSNGARCTISPLSTKTKGHFAVTIAASQGFNPRVVMSGKDVELVRAQEFLTQEAKSLWSVFSGMAAYSSALVGVVLGVVVSRLLRRRNRGPSSTP